MTVPENNSEAGADSSTPASPVSFAALAASRREWIDSVLRPWCRQANLKDLRQAESEWTDIAGRVDVAATLWTWCWERFSGLTHDDFPGVNETHEVTIVLKDRSEVSGFPDSRLSLRGMLILQSRDAQQGTIRQAGPFSIDDITAIRECDR